ncbi:ATP-grasp domain-containing protein [Pseudalkalibacillus hwajinpoensis]|uniref:ATP-grasp domain-containing protein n=1 Tax=Guptibacillus hwajinpoensis TaxID=208199 RepID=A0A4U1MDH7_9BACL|nr:ATP-grasp domain-containing protein [Pseudalkalibacillus hwajinpoensis]TKD69239.1 ATP-grasp domain-containing protein [Pseudalkalibacillus hwajinpoensis]
MKHALLIGSFPYAIEKFKNNGFKVTILISKNELKFGNNSIEKADISLIEDYHWDNKTLIKKIEFLHQLEMYDCVYSFTNDGIELAAVLAEKLNVPGLKKDPVFTTQNKYKLRKSLDKYPEINIESCLFSECKWEEISFPLVLKPISGMGSKGVKLINHFNEIKITDKNNSYLLEKYEQGREFSVETFSNNNKHHLLAITDKLNTGPPNFVGITHSLPSQVSYEDEKRIFSAVEKCLNAVNLDFGPAHTEIVLQESGVKIIETQIRIGGKFYHLLERGINIDAIQLVIDALLDDFNHHIEFNRAGGAAIKYLHASNGKVTNLEVPESVYNNKTLIDLNIRTSIGDVIKEWESTGDRIGYVICNGKDTKDALLNVNNISKLINISTVGD